MHIHHHAKQLTKDKFAIKSSAIVVGVSLIGNIFAYLFQVLLGRYFTVSEYSILTALLSLLVIPHMITHVFFGQIPKYVAEIKDEDYPNKISVLFFTLFKVFAIVSIILFALTIALKTQIFSYLKINNSDSYLMLYFSFAVSMFVFFIYILHFLQGLMRFKAFALVQFLTTFLKFAVAGTVVYLSLNLGNVFLGLGINALLVGIISIILIKKDITFTKARKFDVSSLKTVIKYSMGGALAFVGITLMLNIDVIQVKHYFSPEMAGIYALTAVIGKIIFYVASPITVVMLPIVASKYKKGENYKNSFLTTLSLTLLAVTSIGVVFILFPELVVKILFGSNPTKLLSANYLPLFSLYMIIYTLLAFLAQFFIAISRFKIASLAFLAVVLQFLLMLLYHDTLYAMIWDSIIASGVVVSTMILVGFTFIKKNRSYTI